LLLSGLGSLFIGAFGSITSNSLKRIFTYSSISQMGFCLISLSAGTPQGIENAFMFFFIYIISSVAVFIILLNTKTFIMGNDLTKITDLTLFGIHNKNKARLMSLILLSMAGVPPMAGFLSKALIIETLVISSSYLVAIYTILMSIITSYIYIRMIKCLI
jgi:NADH-quinone oxidoreductase subunit N